MSTTPQAHPSTPRVGVRHLLRLAFARPRPVILALILIAVGVVLSLAQPLVTRTVIESAGDLSRLTALVFLLVGLFVTQTLADAAGQYCLERTSEHIAHDLRRTAASRIIRAPYGALARFRTGDLISRAVGDTTVVRDMLATSLVQVLTIGLYGAGTILLMAWLDPTLLIVLVATLVVVAAIIVGMLASIRQASERHQENIATFTSDLERALGSLRTVKAFLAEDRELRRLEHSIDETRRQGLRLARLNCLVSPAVELAANGALLVILLIGGLRVAGGDIAVSDLVAFLLYAMFLIMPLIGMLNAVTLLQQGRVSLHRVEHLRSLGREETEGTAFPALSAAHGIEFENVTFHRGERQILDDVSFALPATGVVALVGPSGAGKTTILDLIERFETPDAGIIRVHGADASGVALPELRRRIALVDQDAPVAEGTLRENLMQAAPDESDLRYIGALTVAGLADLVGRSSDGLELRVGERGRSLSGGERQRLALARALLVDASIYLLDEPSSQLDPKSENTLLTVIDDLSRNHLVIVIAHRYSTIAKADTILVLDEGSVSAYASPEDAARESSYYQRFSADQDQAMTTEQSSRRQSS